MKTEVQDVCGCGPERVPFSCSLRLYGNRRSCNEASFGASPSGLIIDSFRVSESVTGCGSHCARAGGSDRQERLGVRR